MTRRTLTILHTNDAHGHIAPWIGWEGNLAGKTIGGYDRLASVVNSIRREVGRQNTLLLDAGDAIGDTLIADETKGKAILTLLNYLGYDAMTFGNHEPDFGCDVLKERMKEANFPFLAANLEERSTRHFFATPYVLREVAGIKVGILGLAYPNTPLTTAPQNVADLSYQDPIEAIPPYLPKLRNEGAEIIILLSHYGLGADIKLAERVRGIDVIVGGHSHNRMHEPLRVGQTLIVQAGAHLSDVGRLDITVESGHIVANSYTLHLLDNARIPSDPDTAALVSSLQAPYESKVREQICIIDGRISRAQTLAGQQPRKRDAESPADSLFADILRQETASDLGLLPGVGYGVALGPGIVTADALRNLLPHNSKVITMTLTGAQIEEILEQAVENVLTGDPKQKVGGMIQVSGLSFRYDPQALMSHRVSEVQIGASPLDPSASYRVVTNGLLASGGHRYKTFLQGRERQEHNGQYDTIKMALMRRKKITAPVGGRIQAL